MNSSSYPTWLEINLSAIEANTRYFIELTRTPLMAVIKANAYGFGSIEVGKTLLGAGAEWLAVARYAEAQTLREAGITAPILVFGLTMPEEVDAAIANDITLSMYSFEVASIYAQRTKAVGKPIKVHLKVDTGLGRLGVYADEALSLARFALEKGRIEIDGIYSHLAMVDEGDFPETEHQTVLFSNVVQALSQNGIRPRWIHLAGSSGAIYAPETRFNLVRSGCALLGIAPRNTAPIPKELRRVLSWKAHLASCKMIPMGCGVGYGHAYVTSNEEIIGVLPIGYSDGFRRLPGNEVIIDGKKVPVVGKMCMDMAMVRLPKIYPIGTEAVIIGSQGKATIDLEDLANRWKIGEVDVVSNISLRVPRVYTRD